MSINNSQSSHKKTDQEIEIFTFFACLCLYLLATWILSIFTSSGFAMLYMLIAGVIYFITALVIFSVCLFLNRSQKKELLIYKKFALVILFLQTFLILFNVGDCANGFDQAGNFLQRILTKEEVCSGFSLRPWILGGIILGGFILNFCLLLIFIVFSLLSAKKPTKTGV